MTLVQKLVLSAQVVFFKYADNLIQFVNELKSG